MHTHRRRMTTLITLLALVVCVSALPVRAEEASDKAEFDAIIYIWGAGLQGQVGIGDLASAGIDASFSDILSDLHMAAMGTFAVRKGNWGTIVDAIYLDLHDTVPTPDQTLYGDADIAMGTQLYSGLITYRIHKSPRTAVDLGWGTRYYRIDTDLELTSGVAQGRTAKSTVDWWDWLAAVRFVGHPSKRWALLFYADIGGGGSQMTYEAIAGADFAFSKKASMVFGYRYLDIDYEKNEFHMNLAMPGPYLGIGFHF